MSTRVETENFVFDEQVEFNGTLGLIVQTGKGIWLGNTYRDSWPNAGINATAPGLSVLGNLEQEDDAVAEYITAASSSANPAPLALIANKNSPNDAINFDKIPRECVDADIFKQLRYKSNGVRKFWMPWESEAKPFFISSAFFQAPSNTWRPYVWNENNNTGHITKMTWPNTNLVDANTYNLNYHTPYYTNTGTYINVQSLYMPKNSNTNVISVLQLKMRPGNHSSEAYSTQIDNGEWKIVDAIPAFQRKSLISTSTWGVTDTPFQLEFLELRGFIPAGYTYAIDARDYDNNGTLSTTLSSRFARYFAFAGELSLA